MSAQELSILNTSLCTAVGVVTAQRISDVFALSGSGLRALRLDVLVSGVTQAGTITLSLQTGNDVTGFVTVKSSAAITGNGLVSILMNDSLVATDALVMPLAAHGRLVVTQTHANDRLTVAAALVTQGE